MVITIIGELQMKNTEIKIKLNEKDFKRAVAVADIMVISVDELTENALKSFLYTVKAYLEGIEEHVLPQQIMYE